MEKKIPFTSGIETQETDLARITLASTITLEALLNVLDKKGLIKAEEIINEIRMMQSGSDKQYN